MQKNCWAVATADGKGVAQNYVEAAKWTHKAADKGDAGAQCTLGGMYALGNGVTHDDAKAAQLYRSSAIQGNSDAQTFLGMLYLQGRGVEKNETDGLAWLYVSAASGNEQASKVILPEYESQYQSGIIVAAKGRASELLDQIQAK